MENKVKITFCKTRKEEIKETIELLKQFSTQLLICARGGYLPRRGSSERWRAEEKCEYKEVFVTLISSLYLYCYLLCCFLVL